MYQRMMFEDSPNAISSPASEAGQQPCVSQVGPTIARPGLAHAHASPSAPQASEKANQTSGTCGPTSDASLRSARLQSSLESKLRARMDATGSPEFVLNWKKWDMESGPPICALRARARRISDNAFGGWPTPDAARHVEVDAVGAMKRIQKKRDTGSGKVNLNDVAKLAGWTTPSATDGDRGGTMTENMTGSSLTQLASWATPANRDYRYPNAKSYQERSNSTKGEQLNNQVVHHGPISPSSPASTANRGVLNPAHSRWLMGFPATWDQAAPNWSEWQSVQRDLTERAG